MAAPLSKWYNQNISTTTTTTINMNIRTTPISTSNMLNDNDENNKTNNKIDTIGGSSSILDYTGSNINDEEEEGRNGKTTGEPNPTTMDLRIMDTTSKNIFYQNWKIVLGLVGALVTMIVIVIVATKNKTKTKEQNQPTPGTYIKMTTGLNFYLSSFLLFLIFPVISTSSYL
jgi:hypothetical protein